MEKYFTDVNAWRTLLNNDFNRGYVTAVALVLLIVLLLLVLRIFIALIFRTRRCKAMLVPAPDGDVQIAQEAIESAVRLIVGKFPELELNSLRMYRTGKFRYSLLLNCGFRPSEHDFPAVAAELKERIFDGMEKSFGIDGLRRVRLNLEAYADDRKSDESDREAETASSITPPGVGGDM